MIVGCGRSGTTLLASMLDSHPEVAVPGETGFLLDVCRPARGRGRVVDVFLSRLLAEPRFQAWQLDQRTLADRLHEAQPARPVDALRVVFATFAASRGKDRAADKTPDHVLVIDRLSRLLPEAVFVHVVRDGRDVALALLDVDWGPTSVEEAAWYWQDRVRAGRRAGEQLGSRRYREVRYEQLIADPERELRRLTPALGLDFDAAMLDHLDAAHRQVVMSPDPRSDRHLLSAVRPNLRDWRRDMPAEEVAVFEALAGSTLAACGYERSDESTPMLPPVATNARRRRAAFRRRTLVPRMLAGARTRAEPWIRRSA